MNIPITKPERGAKSESEVQAEIRKHVGSLPDVRVWRNNVGKLPNESGRMVQFGLCDGSSDLVCIVGPFGRWLVIECKEEAWVPARSGKRFEKEENQRKFIAIVRRFGGVGGFARSVAEAMALVEEARNVR